MYESITSLREGSTSDTKRCVTLKKRLEMKNLITVSIIILFSSTVYGQKQRARELGIPFVGNNGKYN